MNTRYLCAAHAGAVALAAGTGTALAHHSFGRQLSLGNPATEAVQAAARRANGR